MPVDNCGAKVPLAPGDSEVIKTASTAAVGRALPIRPHSRATAYPHSSFSILAACVTDSPTISLQPYVTP